MDKLSLAGGSLEITRLGLGAARLTPGRAGARLIEAALERGIRHFDTAPSYGGGLSERLLGEVLAGVSDITITTKVGIARPDRSGISPLHRLYQNFGKPLMAAAPGLKRRLLAVAAPKESAPLERRKLGRDEVERSLDSSCAELGRTPDLLLLHEPAKFLLDAELLHLFQQLQLDGRFRLFGAGAGSIFSQELSFGPVWQGRFDPKQASAGPGISRILHGVLRHAPSTEDPLLYLARTWKRNSSDAFLVSASTPQQLKQITERLSSSS
jgi:aryl-alcohol dehydrogenase-like predicted oxidoreductase